MILSCLFVASLIGGTPERWRSVHGWLSYHIPPDELEIDALHPHAVGAGHLSVLNNSLKSSVFPLPRVVSQHCVEATNYSLVMVTFAERWLCHLKTLSLNLALTLGCINPKIVNPDVTNPNPNPDPNSNPNPNNCGNESQQCATIGSGSVQSWILMSWLSVSLRIAS